MAKNWRDLAQRVRNWDKWCDSDQSGTLNYIMPEKIVAASRLVKRDGVLHGARPSKSGCRLRPGQNPRIHGGRTTVVDSGSRRLTSRATGDQIKSIALRKIA